MGPIYAMRSLTINGIDTDIIINSFSDRLFIIISQMAKLGTLIEMTSEESATAVGGRIYSTPNIILGRRDDPLLLVYARQIAQQMTLGGIGNLQPNNTNTDNTNTENVNELNDEWENVTDMGVLCDDRPLLLAICLQNEGRKSSTFQVIINTLIEMIQK